MAFLASDSGKRLKAEAGVGRWENGQSGHAPGAVRIAPVSTSAAFPSPDRLWSGTAGRVVTNAEARSWLVGAVEFLALIAASMASGTAYEYAARGAPDSLSAFLNVGAVAGLLHWGIGGFLGSGHPQAVSRFEHRIREALLSWLAACALLVFFLFVLKAGHALSRGATLLFFATGLFVAITVRGFLLPVLTRAVRGKAYYRRDALVIADAADPSLAAVLHGLRNAGCAEPFAMTLDAACAPAHWPAERKAAFDRIAAAARAMKAGEIFLCASRIPVDRLQSLKAGLSLVPRTLFVVPDETVSALLRGRNVGALGDCVTVEIQREPLSRAERAVKGIIDICGALGLLALVTPLFVVIALAIKLDSSGPVLFRQTRLGLGGRPFGILKFRTMTVLENGHEVRQARKDDARVTRVGRFLRRTSLDELPQLFNVLKGEMSLVGPRPHPVPLDQACAKSIENYEIRQHVKPGMTGWAQVQGLRGETQTSDLMQERIEADIWYATNASVLFDVRILLLTIVEVMRGRNAY